MTGTLYVNKIKSTITKI